VAGSYKDYAYMSNIRKADWELKCIKMLQESYDKAIKALENLPEKHKKDNIKNRRSIEITFDQINEKIIEFKKNEGKSKGIIILSKNYNIKDWPGALFKLAGMGFDMRYTSKPNVFEIYKETSND
jgi:hypothetical protein